MTTIRYPLPSHILYFDDPRVPAILEATYARGGVLPADRLGPNDPKPMYMYTPQEPRGFWSRFFHPSSEYTRIQ